jgi:hypothetical protein
LSLLGKIIFSKCSIEGLPFCNIVQEIVALDEKVCSSLNAKAHSNKQIRNKKIGKRIIFFILF